MSGNGADPMSSAEPNWDDAEECRAPRAAKGTCGYAGPDGLDACGLKCRYSGESTSHSGRDMTGAERYFAERMTDSDYAALYHEAARQLTSLYEWADAHGVSLPSPDGMTNPTPVESD